MHDRLKRLAKRATKYGGRNRQGAPQDTASNGDNGPVFIYGAFQPSKSEYGAREDPRVLTSPVSTYFDAKVMDKFIDTLSEHWQKSNAYLSLPLDHFGGSGLPAGRVLAFYRTHQDRLGLVGEIPAGESADHAWRKMQENMAAGKAPWGLSSVVLLASLADDNGVPEEAVAHLIPEVALVDDPGHANYDSYVRHATRNPDDFLRNFLDYYDKEIAYMAPNDRKKLELEKRRLGLYNKRTTMLRALASPATDNGGGGGGVHAGGSTDVFASSPYVIYSINGSDEITAEMEIDNNSILTDVLDSKAIPEQYLLLAQEQENDPPHPLAPQNLLSQPRPAAEIPSDKVGVAEETQNTMQIDDNPAVAAESVLNAPVQPTETVREEKENPILVSADAPQNAHLPDSTDKTASPLASTVAVTQVTTMSSEAGAPLMDAMEGVTSSHPQDSAPVETQNMSTGVQESPSLVDERITQPTNPVVAQSRLAAYIAQTVSAPELGAPASHEQQQQQHQFVDSPGADAENYERSRSAKRSADAMTADSDPATGGLDLGSGGSADDMQVDGPATDSVAGAFSTAAPAGTDGLQQQQQQQQEPQSVTLSADEYRQFKALLAMRQPELVEREAAETGTKIQRELEHRENLIAALDEHRGFPDIEENRSAIIDALRSNDPAAVQLGKNLHAVVVKAAASAKNGAKVATQPQPQPQVQQKKSAPVAGVSHPRPGSAPKHAPVSSTPPVQANHTAAPRMERPMQSQQTLSVNWNAPAARSAPNPAVQHQQQQQQQQQQYPGAASMNGYPQRQSNQPSSQQRSGNYYAQQQQQSLYQQDFYPSQPTVEKRMQDEIEQARARLQEKLGSSTMQVRAAASSRGGAAAAGQQRQTNSRHEVYKKLGFAKVHTLDTEAYATQHYQIIGAASSYGGAYNPYASVGTGQSQVPPSPLLVDNDTHLSILSHFINPKTVFSVGTEQQAIERQVELRERAREGAFYDPRGTLARGVMKSEDDYVNFAERTFAKGASVVAGDSFADGADTQRVMMASGHHNAGLQRLVDGAAFEMIQSIAESALDFLPCRSITI